MSSSAAKSRSKPAGPAKSPARPSSRPATASKSAVKTTAKPAAKASAKPSGKSAPKTSIKPVKLVKATAKASAKPLAKPAAKSAGKAPLKSPPKAAVKPAAKTSAKPAAKASSALRGKPPAKAAPKPVVKAAAAPKSVPKAATKASSKAPTKRPAAAPAQAPAKPVIKKGASKPAAASKAAPARGGSPTASVGAAHGFTDRFGPAKSSGRKLPEPIEVTRAAPKPDPKLAGAWKRKAGKELTEAEVLAMPESEYMKDKQIEFFRYRLLTQRDDLLSNAGETTEHLREDTSIVPDPADRATIEEEHALELRTRDRERKLLKKIVQSLARLESGEYGYCDETGEPIGLARLIARPTATLSLEAQQRRELKQKMFGD